MTKERRTTPHDAALPVLFVREQFRTEGFEPFYRHTYFIPNVLFIHLSLLCFKARVTDPVLDKRGIKVHAHKFLMPSDCLISVLIQAQVCNLKGIAEATELVNRINDFISFPI